MPPSRGWEARGVKADPAAGRDLQHPDSWMWIHTSTHINTPRCISSFKRKSFKRLLPPFPSPLRRFGGRFKRPKYFHRVPLAIVYLKQVALLVEQSGVSTPVC